MVELLLNEKADIDSFGESEQHWSPLHLAAMRGHTAAVEILVNRAADFKAEWFAKGNLANGDPPFLCHHADRSTFQIS
eukprot:symbB.v1.2.036150.t1/scaffold5036.1/size31615/2